MTVPDFQSLMLPLLRLAGDDHEHTNSQTANALADEFALTEDEKNELLPSGRQARFDNRVGWARTYLQKAGLLERTGRGRFKISEQGRQVLAGNPESIDMKYLERFPAYIEWRDRSRQSGQPGEGTSALTDAPQTPEETLEAAHQALRGALARELLERVRAETSRFFENLVIDVLVAMGYGGSRKDAAQAVGRSGDEGIDGIIKEDRLGLDVIYVQAKRWEGTVGRPVVQSFAGSLEGHHARKGIMITTSDFSSGALEYVKRIEKKIVLIDGETLAQYMVDHGVGVTPEATYTVHRIDMDYFEEGE